jgi:hypothetical protein
MADANRPSISTDLATKYQTSKVGGAYDAKKAGTSTETSPQAALYDNTGNFVVNAQKGISNFKGANSQNYTEISSLAKGLNTTKYKG